MMICHVTFMWALPTFQIMVHFVLFHDSVVLFVSVNQHVLPSKCCHLPAGCGDSVAHRVSCHASEADESDLHAECDALRTTVGQLPGNT